MDTELRKASNLANPEKPRQFAKPTNDRNGRLNEQAEPKSDDDSFNQNEIITGTKKYIEGKQGDSSNQKDKTQARGAEEERKTSKNLDLAKQRELDQNLASRQAKTKKPGEPGHHLLMWSNVKDFNQVINNINLKTFTLKQLKDFIEEVYSAKTVFDKKCKDHNLPKETLEQFLYSHLKQKYGLNTMVIEFVYAVIEGIKTYVDKDNDVAVFFHVI